MRLLWVSTDDPSEPGGGAWRQAATRHDVHLVTDALPPGEVTAAAGGRQITAEGINWWSRFPSTRVARALIAARPGAPVDVRAARGRMRAIAEVLRRASGRIEPDLVIVEASELVPAPLLSPYPYALLLRDSLAARYLRRASEARRGPRRIRWRLEARRGARWERRLARHAITVACTDPRSLELLRSALRRDVELVLAGELDSWLARHVRSPRPAPSAQDGDRPSVPKHQSATIVVCTRERPRLLERSLPSLAEAGRVPPTAELLIVEQGEPFAEELCSRLGIEARVVRDPGAGPGRARNVGGRAARGEVLLLTDDDCAVPRMWVRDHLDALARPGTIASCGVVEGLSRFGDGPDPVARRARHHMGSPPWAIGHSANLAVRREAFLAIGGFDERLAHGEDPDLIVRLLRTGDAIEAGVGSPVLHFEWRSEAAERRNLRAYEYGAGAWIGKLLREDRQAGIPYLRERLSLLRNRVVGTAGDLDIRYEPGLLRAPATVLPALGAFVNGLWFGYRLGPWPGG